MKQKEISPKIRKVIAAYVKAARHVRNFPHPELSIEILRREATEADMLAENILGEEEYEKINRIAFKKSPSK